jgi:hypothetical protein
LFKTKVLSAIVFAAIISTGYFYGSALATSSITQQSSQSSITSNGSSVTSSRIESSTGGAGLKEDLQLAGKIAGSQLNLTTGSVEAVLFGDWTLESSGGEASFAANFTQTLQADNSTVDYQVGNTTVTSVQKINDSIVLSGSADITSSNVTQTTRGAPIAVMVVDKKLVAISFGGEAGALFGGMPVTGVVSN